MLQGLDYLRQAVGLRAYAQRNPLNEYKMEAFELFQQMLAQLREHVTSLLSVLEIRFAYKRGGLCHVRRATLMDAEGLPGDIVNIRRQSTRSACDQETSRPCAASSSAICTATSGTNRGQGNGAAKPQTVRR